jgi:hypothetical protein
MLYGCETLSVTLKEEHRMLRRIFGPETEKVTGGWETYMTRIFLIYILYQI